MSAETPEHVANYHQRTREKIAAAIADWKADESADHHPLCEADALDNSLIHQDLNILPVAGGDSHWRVLVDGEPAPYPGTNRPAGPLDADDTAEVFLIAALAAEKSGVNHVITVRPATNAEMVQDAIGGGM